ncbi:MAG: hypothetical protein V1911_03275 [Candidatus Micrarchaeota archaeon]
MLSALAKKLIFARQFKMNDGEMQILSVHHISMPTLSFINLTKDLHASEAESPVAMYNSGIAAGSEMARQYKKRTGMGGLQLINLVKDVHEMSGWGRWQIRKNEDHFTHVCDNSEYARAKKDSCDLLRGIIAGQMRVAFNSPAIEAVEVECASNKGKFCRFVTMDSSKFDRKSDTVKAQLPHLL